MARLHEYQGKALLEQFGISVPDGGPAATPEEARRLAEDINAPVVVKAQAWVTGRASLGAIRFADTPASAEAAARDLLGMQIGQFTVDRIMVERKLAIAQEFYAGVIVDDRARAPVVIFSSVGGTGIEQIAEQHPDKVARHTVDIRLGLRDFEAREMARLVGISGRLLLKLGGVIVKLYDAAHAYDARAAEINPLVLTEDGDLVAADCRFTVDDYAVFRHKDLGIEIAREFDRPPTQLERIAWAVEKGDYRGTFYFIQMEQDFEKGDRVIGFHGAGGGGSMMSMDAVLSKGFKIANFVDTSGNPPASKVYRAAKIILSQPGIDGYFGSGSGVASQEQFHSARGLVKAFMEEPLTVPAVVRLGGNAEDLAVEILHRARDEFSAPVEGYKKDDPPDFCAERLKALVDAWRPPSGAAVPSGRTKPNAAEPYTFETVTDGMVTLDHARCRKCESKICIESCVPKILSLEDNVPVLNITRQEAKRGGCVECLACEIECYFLGNQGGFVELPIAGLETYRQTQT